MFYDSHVHKIIGTMQCKVALVLAITRILGPMAGLSSEELNGILKGNQRS
ncbi:hypothetical protein SBF1_1100004 [Candidatus Desulfosporosinus infrequens]|uniref:Uncharacterized protein n=1 Tax=Candidatus Desulfosporosinus infrequens TaxID=2043169 RepID=A0A2U3JXG0_9FIRM|nr:hypothetical protein SBF1_1100004 [Candidatus Desulfosporosinus infrequens]